MRSTVERQHEVYNADVHRKLPDRLLAQVRSSITEPTRCLIGSQIDLTRGCREYFAWLITL